MTQTGRANDLVVVEDFLKEVGLDDEKNKAIKDAWLRIRGEVRRAARISSQQLLIAQKAVRTRDDAQGIIDTLLDNTDPEPEKG